MSMQGPALAVPTQFLAGRAAAAGIAAMKLDHDVQRVCGAELDGLDEGPHGKLMTPGSGERARHCLALLCAAKGTMYMLDASSLKRRAIGVGKELAEEGL